MGSRNVVPALGVREASPRMSIRAPRFLTSISAFLLTTTMPRTRQHTRGGDDDTVSQDINPKNYRELRYGVAQIERNQAVLPDTVCPACLRSFETAKGRNSHLSTAKGCSQYRKGKFKASLLSENSRLLPLVAPAVSQTFTSRIGSRIPIPGNQGFKEASPFLLREDPPPADEGSSFPLEVDPLSAVAEDSSQINAPDWEEIIEIAPVATLTHRQLRLQKATAEQERWLEAALDNQPPQVLDGEIGAPEEEEDQERLEEMDDVLEALIEDISLISLDLKETFAMDVDDEAEGSGSSFRQQMLGRVLQESEDNWKVEEPAPRLKAGQVKVMKPELLAEWKKQFGTAGTAAEEQRQLPLDLFSSRLDWEIGNWAIRDSASNSAFNRLLAIPGVRAKVIIKLNTLIY